MKNSCELAVKLPTIPGEGAIWDAKRQKLYWVVNEGQAVFIYDPRTADNVRHNVGERVGTVVPKRDGTLVLALENSVAEFSPRHPAHFLTGLPSRPICRRTAPTTENAIRPDACGSARLHRGIDPEAAVCTGWPRVSP